MADLGMDYLSVEQQNMCCVKEHIILLDAGCFP